MIARVNAGRLLNRSPRNPSRAALDGYHCEILVCVTQEIQAFARRRIPGIHISPFGGHAAPEMNGIGWRQVMVHR